MIHALQWDWNVEAPQATAAPTEAWAAVEPQPQLPLIGFMVGAGLGLWIWAVVGTLAWMLIG